MCLHGKFVLMALVSADSNLLLWLLGKYYEVCIYESSLVKLTIYIVTVELVVFLVIIIAPIKQLIEALTLE